MIIQDDRSSFDTALADSANTFLLLFGTNNETKAIHDAAVNVAEFWNQTFLIEKVGILTAAEKSWFTNEDKYTILAKPKQGNPRAIVEQQALTNLCTKAGKPDSRKIGAAFGRADAA